MRSERQGSVALVLVTVSDAPEKIASEFAELTELLSKYVDDQRHTNPSQSRLNALESHSGTLRALLVARAIIGAESYFNNSR